MNEQQVNSMKAKARDQIITHWASNAELAKSPKIFVKGEGCYLYDIEGRRYLDTFASLLTTICGHGRTEVAEAAAEQMRQLEFFPNYVDTFTLPLIELADKLAELAPGDLQVSFFVNSGSEANETAIKMAKQYHWQRGEKTRRKIIARRYSFHGTTLGGISTTGIPWFREMFEPLLPDVRFAMSTQCCHCELGLKPESCELLCLRSMQKLIEWEGPESVAAIIMDPIPGSNTGYPLPPDGYLEGLRQYCDEQGILLIFDEVQTGFGKTGKMFACEHWGVVPDIMTIGKGFTGGYLPLGGLITTKKVADQFKEPGCELRSGSTYGGHTTACAATLVNLGIIQKEALVERAAEMGEYIKGRLEKLKEKYPIVDDVRGIGMLWAVELMVGPEKPKQIDAKLDVGGWIRQYCWDHGMILRNNGDILVIAPALIISREDVDLMLGLMDEGIAAAVAEFELG